MKSSTLNNLSKHKWIPAIILGLFVMSGIFTGCSGLPPRFTLVSLGEAKNLKEYCAKEKISTAGTKLADSLLNDARVQFEAKNIEDAEWKADLAVGYYKVSILQSELDKSKKKVKKLESELAEDKEKLTSLSDVYEEIKALRTQ